MALRKPNVNKARKTLEIRGSQNNQSSTGRDTTGRSKAHENRRTTAENDTPGATPKRTTRATSRDGSTGGPAPVTPARPAVLLPLAGQSLVDGAAADSLYTYLNSFRPDPPLVSSAATSGQNTRNDSEYSFKDIVLPVQQWPLFTREHCMRNFAPQLRTTATQPPVILSPQNVPEKAVSSELGVGEFLHGLTAVVNRALRDSNHNLTDRPGSEAAISNLKADRSGLLPNGQVRLVGDIKVSWKWKSCWRWEPPTSAHNKEYRQVLSQVHSYMNRAGCRWGYVLTDEEFVALERGSRFGELRVAEAVKWKSSGDEWNVGMAAWCLHAMASVDGWHLPTVSRRPEAVASAEEPVAPSEGTVQSERLRHSQGMEGLEGLERQEGLESEEGLDGLEMSESEEGLERQQKQEGQEGKVLRRSPRLKALEGRRAKALAAGYLS